MPFLAESQWASDHGGGGGGGIGTGGGGGGNGISYLPIALARRKASTPKIIRQAPMIISGTEY